MCKACKASRTGKASKTGIKGTSSTTGMKGRKDRAGPAKQAKEKQKGQGSGRASRKGRKGIAGRTCRAGGACRTSRASLHVSTAALASTSVSADSSRVSIAALGSTVPLARLCALRVQRVTSVVRARPRALSVHQVVLQTIAVWLPVIHARMASFSAAVASPRVMIVLSASTRLRRMASPAAQSANVHRTRVVRLRTATADATRMVRCTGMLPHARGAVNARPCPAARYPPCP